jgi:predicted phosphodiesterase
MKIAVISDIHANLYALKEVAKDIVSQKIETIYCLGDVVGYGPHPQECLEMVSKYAKECVKGNHEDAMDNAETYFSLNPRAQAGVKYSKEHLSRELLDVTKKLPYTVLLKDLDMVLCHGSYSDANDFNYINSPARAKTEIGILPCRICVIGHTHNPFVFGSKNGLYEDLPDNLCLDKDEKFIVNVGSVGQPRDGDVRSCYCLLEIDNNRNITVNFRRVFYDIQKTADSMISAGLPMALSDRLFRGE